MSVIDKHVRQALAAEAERAAGSAEAWVDLVAQSGRQYAWQVWNVLLSRTVTDGVAPLTALGATEAAQAPARPGRVFGPVPFVHVPAGRRRVAAGAGRWPGDLAPGMLAMDDRPVIVLPANGADPRSVQVWLVAEPADSPAERAVAELLASEGSVRDAAATAVARAWSDFLPAAPSGLLGSTRWWPPIGVDEVVRDAAELWVLAAHGLPIADVPELVAMVELALAGVPATDRGAVGLYLAEQVAALGRDVVKYRSPEWFHGGHARIPAPLLPLGQDAPDGRPAGGGVWSLPGLAAWYDQVHIERTGHHAACRACDLSRDLTVVWTGTDEGDPQSVLWDELVPLCFRCAALVDELIVERTQPGGRWEAMPVALRIRAAVSMVLSNRIDVVL